ncbi:MAG: TRAP transporter substrate-binding protein [Rhodobiaceae bacterium]|nr:TRAP transporter substrate-binding protein [Rhodobiaceae bacterium]MCC0055331.1 TRAP transporter substrate-binding protein [Rhodobiaceae bacterium]
MKKSVKLLTLMLGASLLAAAPATAQDKKITLQLAGSYPAPTSILGPAQERLTKQIEALSGGSIEVKFFAPGALLPPKEYFDAISSGALDAAFTDSLIWSGKDIGFTLFTNVPFGPGAPEYLAWMKQGGGEEMMKELYGKYNIVSMVCGFLAAEGGGWFRKPIDSLDDLKGLKFRIGGLGGNVMEKLGVSTQNISPGELLQALQLGTVDAAEFSMPSIDKSLGFQTVTKYYYFPGWQAQSSFPVLLISKAKWDAMSQQQKDSVQAACDQSTMSMLTEGEALQPKALADLEAAGVEIREYPEDVLKALEEKWQEVAAEQAQKSENFKKAWDSYSAFRAQYAKWKKIGFVK